MTENHLKVLQVFLRGALPLTMVFSTKHLFPDDLRTQILMGHLVLCYQALSALQELKMLIIVRKLFISSVRCSVNIIGTMRLNTDPVQHLKPSLPKEKTECLSGVMHSRMD